jgi:alpha-glucosidase
VLHFERPGGWTTVTNFGVDAFPLPEGEVLVSSVPLERGLLPADATAWLLVAPTAAG